jgi:hypothetical protein
MDAPFNILEAQIEPVDTPPDLEEVDDYSLLDNARKPVKQGNQTFYVDRSSTATPNGSTVVATKSGEGRWLLLPSAGGSLPASVQRYWVGKHGNDANTGLSYDTAKLTLTSAKDAAVAATPSSTNQFSITCLDAGVYAEDITLSDWVHLYAPNITLQGTLTVADDTYTDIGTVEASGNPYGILKPSGQTGTTRVEAQAVYATGGSTGCANLATGGVLIYEVRSTFVENGNAIGDASVANGHTHIMAEDIYITGTGIGIARIGSGTTIGYVAHILEIGAGSGAGIVCNGGEVSLKTLYLDSTQAYNVGASGTLRLDANVITGTTAGTGAAYINTAGYTTTAPANWNPPVPTDLNDAIDRLATAVQGLLGGAIP